MPIRYLPAFLFRGGKATGVPELTINLPMSSAFNAVTGLNLTGSSTADIVR
jgi:hypothetical protein